VKTVKFSAFTGTVVRKWLQKLCFHCVVSIDCRMLKSMRLGDLQYIPNLLTFG
jgi:hypothetical protein